MPLPMDPDRDPELDPGPGLGRGPGPDPQRAPTPAEPRPPIAGVGASAGGLAALGDFLAHVPRDTAHAIVVVQHLSPDGPSALATLLQARCLLPVHDAVDGATLSAGTVHVITPDTQLTVQRGRLRVQQRAGHTASGATDLIDRLLVSIAADAGQRSVGVVLSGMGGDGTAGLAAVLAAKGRALAQCAGDAAFDAMPASARGLGPAVVTGTAAALGARLGTAVEAAGKRVGAPAAPPIPTPVTPTGAPPDVVPAASAPPTAPPHPDAEPNGPNTPRSDDLGALLAELAKACGHDFSGYKRSTLHRRIERRMALHGVAQMADYLALMRHSEGEAQLLFKELLVGVTSFFRDSASWARLQAAVLPAMVQRAAARRPPALRAWVAGCSTGEEAYTLAMVLRDAVAAAGLPAGTAPAVQVFGSDLSDDAIAVARRGWYTDAALTSLTPEQRQRWFVRDRHGWRVNSTLRDTVLFARHDLLSDPPFSRLDLVSCRNVLIYLQAPLQQRLLPLFHYLLMPGGVLMLGASETLGRSEPLFTPVDSACRLFEACGTARVSTAVHFPVRGGVAPVLVDNVPMPDPAASPTHSTEHAATDRWMLEHVAPPAVLINAAGDILHLSGRTGRYLAPAAGKANWNVHAMVQPALRTALLAALAEAGHGRAEARRVVGAVELSVRPVSPPDAGNDTRWLVVFQEPPASARPSAETGATAADDGAGTAATAHAAEAAAAAADVAMAEARSQFARELQALRDEMHSSQQELQAANEELQSANEELTTSKEEMQAMNEELQTVNAELMARLEELATAQSDLRNLLNSTQIATVFLGADGQVRRFTEQAKTVISLRDSDIGRPLTDLATALDYPSLHEDMRTVLRTLQPRESEVRTRDGRWFSVRIMAYRTLGNVIDGSVITFADISAAKALEARLRLGASDDHGTA